MNPEEAFDRPVFILGAPRSGTTLLFETLAKAAGVWTVGGESHAVIEGIPELQPGHGGRDSNRLLATDATPEIKRSLCQRFLQQLRDRDGHAWVESNPGRIRMLEKTPKNALRIPFLNAVYPDSLFIYLYRDPRRNISSIMESWRSGRYVTYHALPDWEGPWSLLLPPGWRELRGRSLAELAAFQWESANRYILEDLGCLAPARWMAVDFSTFVRDPSGHVRRLCEFSGIEFDPALSRATSQPLPLSRSTLTPPDTGKWRKNEEEIASVLPSLTPLIERAEMAVALRNHNFPSSSGRNRLPKIGRNAPCPCGSGRKYKHCHGHR
jgi:hypothetical protein